MLKLLRRFRSTQTAANANALEKCHGCGAKFQETHKTRAGYLPQLDMRRAAYLSGVPFKEYKDLAGIKDFSLDKYMKKRQLELGHVSDKSMLNLSDLKADNLRAFVQDSVEVSAAERESSEVDTVVKNIVKELLCARCHKMTFSQRSGLSTDEDNVNITEASLAWQRISESILTNDMPPLIVYVVDLLTFPNSLNSLFLQSVMQKSKVILALNKFDLLPEHSNYAFIKEKIKFELKDYKNVSYEVISAKKQEGIESLIKRAMLLRSAGQDIYVVGEANAGKSTLLNAFRAKATLSTEGPIKRFSTSSIVPGTTMDEIKYPLKEMDKIRDIMTKSRTKITAEKQKKALEDIKNKVKVKDLPDKGVSLAKSLQGYLVDTPGIAAENHLAQHLTEEELRFALPTDKLKFTHIYFMPGKSIYFGGLGRIDYVEGKAQVICTVFHGPKIPIHINNTEKFDDFWQNNAGGRNTKWEEKLVLQNNSSKVIRKNYNKDLWSGVKLVPPFFTSPEKFAADPGRDGLLHDRLEKYPEMKLALESTVTREKPLDDHAHSSSHFRQSLVDFVVSGFGWFSIAGNFCKESDKTATFRLWSPDGKGIFERQPLLPFLSGLRGKKRKGLPYYSKYDPKLAAKLQALESDYLKTLK